MGASLRNKVLLAFLFVGISSLSVTGGLGYFSARASLEETTFDGLIAVSETKKRQIEDHFEQIRDHAGALAVWRSVINAMKELSDTFAAGNDELKDEGAACRVALEAYYRETLLARLNPSLPEPIDLEALFPEDALTRALQCEYLLEDPIPAGFSAFRRVVDRIDPTVTRIAERFGYDDLFLIDPEHGRILYAVNPEVDLVTSLRTGPHRGSNLARAFEAAAAATTPDFVALVDFDFYLPSYGSPAAFMATPILDAGQLVGVLAFQLPVDQIERIMTGNYQWSREGLDETGETLIVGPDHRMRNNSRFFIEEPDRFFRTLDENGVSRGAIDRIESLGTTILLQEVRVPAAVEALEGSTGTLIGDDYRGAQVLASYTPLAIEGLHWGLVSKIDAEEAFAPVAALRFRIAIVALIVAIVVTIIAFLLAGGMVQSIRRLMRGIHDIAKGDLSRRVEVPSTDEVGALAVAFNDMASKLEARTREVEEKQTQLVQSERMAALGALIAGIAHEINSPLGVMAGSADVSARCVEKLHGLIESSGSIEELRDSKSLRKLLQVLDENDRTLHTASDRLSSVVTSLKNYIRLDQAEVQEADLHEGIESALTLMGHELKGIRVVRQFGELPRLLCYPSELNQVFMCLLQNAAQAIEGEGEIRIGTSLRNGIVEIAISDTGPGIPADEQETLFMPKFSRKRGRMGMGIGLATAYNIVRNHGGDIGVKSETGRGTEIRIQLPSSGVSLDET